MLSSLVASFVERNGVFDATQKPSLVAPAWLVASVEDVLRSLQDVLCKIGERMKTVLNTPAPSRFQRAGSLMTSLMTSL